MSLTSNTDGSPQSSSTSGKHDVILNSVVSPGDEELPISRLRASTAFLVAHLSELERTREVAKKFHTPQSRQKPHRILLGKPRVSLDKHPVARTRRLRFCDEVTCVDDRVQKSRGKTHCDCDWCRLVKGQSQGRLISIKDTELPPGYHEPDRAVRTLPAVFVLRESRIPGAGLGVFTKHQPVEVGVVFDPYEGIIRPPYDSSSTDYSWQVSLNGKPAYQIAADDSGFSNWLRYINCARNEEEENITAFQFNGKIYYRTSQHIPANTELLVYYGHIYADELGIEPYNETQSKLRRSN